MEVAGKRLDDDPVSCEPCQEENVWTQADGYCNDCGENMCKACFQSHLKLKLCRNHVLGAIDGGRRHVAQKQEDKCKKHTTEVIKYYCRNHDSVGCGDCIVSYHKKCDTEFIKDLAKNFEESPDFKSIVKEVDNLEDLKAKIEVSLEKYRKDNTEFHEKAIHEIQQNRAEINTWIDSVTSNVEEEEMEIWKENEKVLSKLEDWVKIISDMIDKAREEINNKKYKGESLFIRVIECKTKISDFATKRVPEIKSNLSIKSFTFEPNKQLFVLKKSTNLGVIRVWKRSDELQTSQKEQQNNLTLNDGATNVASSDLPEADAEDVGTGGNGTVNRSESIICLKQEINSLKSQLDTRIKENEIMESKSKARQEQDHNTIKFLQSELKKLRQELQQTCENHEKERESQSPQSLDLQRQRASAEKTYQLPDPRAAGFDVGKRVKRTVLPGLGWTGRVTAVDPSGYVDVQWDNGSVSSRWAAGAKGQYYVQLM